MSLENNKKGCKFQLTSRSHFCALTWLMAKIKIAAWERFMVVAYSNYRSLQMRRWITRWTTAV